MNYRKRGRFGSRPGKTEPGQQTRDQRDLRERQRDNAMRREMSAMMGTFGEVTPSKDHLPGTDEDRFGGVYRKGGATDRDLPNTSRYGRGYSDDALR